MVFYQGKVASDKHRCYMSIKKSQTRTSKQFSGLLRLSTSDHVSFRKPVTTKALGLPHSTVIHTTQHAALTQCLYLFLNDFPLGRSLEGVFTLNLYLLLLLLLLIPEMLNSLQLLLHTGCLHCDHTLSMLSLHSTALLNLNG